MTISVEAGRSGGRPPSPTRLALRRELNRRLELFNQSQNMPREEVTTIRSLYYKLRKLMGGHLEGIGSRNTYQSFSAMLREEVKKLGCIGEGRCTGWREMLGIIASERAQFLFRGEVTPIRFGNVQHLSLKGSDVVLCEKEGICELLEPYAATYGVAIVNTRGFSPDYVKWLATIMSSPDSQANLFILTDMDSAGYMMGENIPHAHRLGIDRATLTELNIPLESVEEELPNPEEASSHLVHLESTGHYDPAHLNFLKHRRVEIDAVLAYVKTERFWEYLKAKMEQLKPNRKIRRSLSLKVHYPTSVTAILDELRDILAEPGSDAILSEVEAKGYGEYIPQNLEDIENMEEELTELGKSAIEEDERIARIVKTLREIISGHDLKLGAGTN